MSKKDESLPPEEMSLHELNKSIRLLKRQQKAIESRDSLMAFTKFTMPDPEDPGDADLSIYQNARHHDALAAVLEEVEKGEIEFLIVTFPPRHGKALAHDTPVLTPKGWTTHGELREGDEVFGLDGKPARVKALSGDVEVDTAVDFSDGERILCHPAHEWTVQDMSKSREVTLETEKLARSFWIGPLHKHGGRARWRLPRAGAVRVGGRLYPPRAKKSVSIRDFHKVSPQQGRCIQVDREDGLYLVGKTLIPTHNSELVSRRLPAWFLGRNPGQHVVVATYSDDFAKDFGADVRGVMRQHAYRAAFPDVKLERGGSAKDRLQTTQGGMAAFVGVGGALSGRGANLLIIDDLIKDYEQARSKAFRERAWDWFTKVAMTRRMGKKLVVITFTRWHTDDIIGRLTDPENEHFNREMANKIKVIDFPAIAGEDDPLHRKPGEALWPERYDLNFLEEQRSLDPLGFEALYQQRPSAADGTLFRRESIQFHGPDERVKTPPLNEMRIYCASDHAVSTAQRADSTVLLRVGLDRQNNIYVLDCWWRKASTDIVVEAMITMAKDEPKPLIWWAERGHISKSIGPFLRKRMSETNTFFNIVEVTPVADKEQRAQAISARMAMGRVYLPRNKPWTEKAVNELLAFPNGLHDDFCLAGDTPVTMGDGTLRPIAEVQVGDLVSTPKGPRKVIASEQTNPRAKVMRVSLSDGRSIVATPNHPVFVQGKGFVNVDTLAYGDVVFNSIQETTWPPNTKHTSTGATDTGDTRAASTCTSDGIFIPRGIAEGFYIATSGRMLLGLSRKAMRFTTRITTQITMTSQILSASLFQNTALTTCPSGPVRRNTWPSLTLSDLSPLRGTQAPKGKRGTAKTLKLCGQTSRKSLRAWFNACAATPISKPTCPPADGSVTRTARPDSNTEAQTETSLRMSRALAAEPRSRPKGIFRDGSVTRTAVSVTTVEALTNRIPVYNLTVEGEHVFFANGVLTHNCDALAYIGLGLQSQVPVTSKAEPDKPMRTGTFGWVKDQVRRQERTTFNLGGF